MKFVLCFPRPVSRSSLVWEPRLQRGPLISRRAFAQWSKDSHSLPPSTTTVSN